MTALLKKRHQIIRDYYEENYVLPSYRVMVELFGVKSTGSVGKTIDRLLRHGILKKISPQRLAPTDLFFDKSLIP